VQVKLVQGEGAEASWTLEAISVYGSVKSPAGKTLENATVWLEGTSYQQIVGEDGSYRFADWDAHGILASGKTYTLRAESEERYQAEATFTFEGHEPIQSDLNLVEKTWFEVAQIRFDRKDNEGAIAAFQNGIETTTDFPPMSPALTKLLFDSFSAAIDKVNLENTAYIVATAKLADQVGQKERAKVYWGRVKSEAAKGTADHKLATKRLRELNFGRYLINIGILVLVIIVLISGGYTFYRQKRSKG
jgi:hypothetical protein